jgi:hypothetical protein
MAKRFLCLVVLVAFCLLGSTDVMAQVSSTGQLLGTVSDQTGAVIAGATIKIKDDATGNVIETKSSADGHFSAGSLRPGTYTVAVSMQGFKSAEYRAVKVTVGQVYDLAAKLEVGALESTVVVEAGAEVLETSSTTVGTSITGKSITQLPLASRDALDLAILMPGAATTGRARQTSFMGLPKGAINITMDGINAQDNVLKSNDGFFTLIRPRIDSIEEFSISTAGQGAEQSSEGAVQIRFETKRGGNVYHGGGWWYHRNDYFNSNYYFSNQTKTRRQRQRLNQFGGNVGGPVWKDKMFFFASMDIYRNPSTQVRTRTIFAPNGATGLFDYAVSAMPSAATLLAAPWVTCSASSPRIVPGTSPAGICTANLLAAGAPGGATVLGLVNNSVDPSAAVILTAVNSARAAPGVALNPIPSPWLDSITFNNPGDATRRFPDLRLDWNITKSIQWTGIYHYNYFISKPDFLNSFDQSYPVAPFNTNQGSQISNRNEWVMAVRWNIAANKSNEVRFGLVTSPVSFFPDLNASLYPAATNNLGSVNIRRAFPTISTPILGWSVQGRNGGLWQLIDTFSWSKGKHNVMIGGNWTHIRKLGTFSSTQVNTASLAANSSDPATGVIGSTGTLPGSSSTDRSNAAALYAALTGRVSSYTGSVAVDPATRLFAAGGRSFQDLGQNEFGFYASDSFRIHPKLTINYGLRWEFQGVPYDTDNITFNVQGGGAGAFGVSGNNNLFKPGTMPGTIPVFELNGNKKWYNNDMNNFAPNVGLAWTPGFSNSILKTVFGESGKTVFRISYSTTYTREGTNNFENIVFNNPGAFGSIDVTAVTPGATCTPPFSSIGTFPAGCLTLTGLYAGNLQALRTIPAAFPTAPFQISSLGQSVNTFSNNMRTPLVHNWSVGIQRELTSNLVLEVRYVGNHGSGLIRQIDVNEVNIFENGFLTEFGLAQSNLAICRANQLACRTAAGSTSTTFASFANLGLAGQVAVPIMTQAFTGLVAGSQTNSQFANGTNITSLDNGAAGSFANTLANTSSFLCNLIGTTALPGATCVGTAPVTSLIPANFWVASPNSAGSFLFNNATHSTYNGMTMELRKRYSKGLQFSGNYTFAKALTNYFGDASNSFAGFSTLRNPAYDKGASPWDLRHTFKINGIYSLPFGPGRKWNSSHGWVNRFIEGWEISAVNRWQSGRVFQLTSGNSFRTVNGGEAGVILAGITPKQIQDSLNIRKLPTGQVYFFPASLIGSNGQANTTFIKPCNTPGKLCSKIFLYGPSFFRADINVVKKIRITERIEMEYRAEFLNAFNNINFFFPGSETTSVATSAITGTSFGQVTNAFRDVSTTDDNGGRIIQMVLRIRF